VTAIRTHRALKTTVWIECGRELISTDDDPTARKYCPLALWVHDDDGYGAVLVDEGRGEQHAAAG